MKKLLAFAVLVVVAVLIVFIYVSKSAPPVAPFATVTRETIMDTLTTNGKAEPAEWQAVHAERPGSILRVPVQKGQQVAKGAVLAEMDAIAAREELTAAESRIAQARAELAVIDSGGRGTDLAEIEGSLRKARLEAQAAQREAESLQRLVAKKAATTVEWNAAKDRAAQAQAQIQSIEQRKAALVAKTDRTVAEARLRDAEAAAEAARRRIAQSVIYSPLAGEVYTLSARPGAFLNAGDLVAQVGRLARMKVIVYVDEPELGRVRAGMQVAVTWDAKAGREWKGTVEKVPTAITIIGTRQVGEVTCYVDNPGGELLPGTNINAAIRSQVVENAIVLPKETIRRDAGQTGVLLLAGDRVTWRAVKIGVSNVTRAQVLEGVKAGDRVLLPTEQSIMSGDKVQPAKP